MKKLSVFALIAALVISMFTLCTAAIEAETTAPETTAEVTTDSEEIASPEESDAETTADDGKFSANPMNFVSNLSYMGLGMLGIFIVIGLVMIVTYVLNRAFSGKKDNEQ